MIESDDLIYSRYLAERNEADFRVLLERHKESLMLFLYSFVHNMEDAEELMLDDYAEAAAGANYSGKSTFKTWLFSIGKKMALMRLRKQRFAARAIYPVGGSLCQDSERSNAALTDEPLSPAGGSLCQDSGRPKPTLIDEESFGRTGEAVGPPELNILREERNRQLYEALSGLKEDYRQILILLYFEEMSHEEAGKVMGKTKRQTYHLAERGRAALKEKLERMGFDYAQY